MVAAKIVSLLSKPSIHIFLAGILVGFSIGLLIISKNSENSDQYVDRMKKSIPIFDFADDHSDEDTNHRIMINTSMADDLFKKVRVLCWVLTSPQNHLKKAVHVKATWGRRCNKLLFMSTEKDSILSSVALPVKEGRQYLWSKTKQALLYVYEHYYNQYDWFFKADDDTFAVMENLRYMLYYMNTSEPIYYGCKMKYRVEHLDYMSGGAGYVLSKEALRRFVYEALPNKTICSQKDIGDEDVEIGKCLQGVGVELGDSLDNANKNMFTPVFVNDMLIPGVLTEVDWYMEMMYNPHKLGPKCCSGNLITTHYVLPHQMYLLEYLIYHVKPFGWSYKPILDKVKKKKNQKYFHYRMTGSTEQLPQWDDYD